MTEMPEDIMDAAFDAAINYNCYPYKSLVDIIARAILAERERATMKERERIEGMIDKAIRANIGFFYSGPFERWLSNFRAAIISGEEAGK